MDGQANIRGGSGYSYGAGSRVMLLMDDLPILTGDVNEVKWNYLPVEIIGQVEVIKGASSALYGSLSGLKRRNGGTGCRPSAEYKPRICEKPAPLTSPWESAVFGMKDTAPTITSITEGLMLQ